MRALRFYLAGLALLLAPGALLAQQSDSLAGPAQQLRRYNQQALTEELFVHTDRPAYAAGETMWLKVYAVDGTLHRPLPMSKVAYVEVLGPDQHPVLQARLALREAVGQGSLALPAELATGRYVLRAYTNWMKNAGPAFYFQTPLTIVNTWQPATTAPAAAAPATAPAFDVQFFPEGGQLVPGLAGTVGFKATDRRGRGVAVAGTVADGQGREVARFESLKFGMGSFGFTPLAGTSYVATVRLPGGAALAVPLPAAVPQGYALHLRDTDTNYLLLDVQTAAAPAPLYLLAHTGQQLTATASAALAGGTATFRVDKRTLRPGITHFTVFAGRRPVAERLYWQRPGRGLALQASGGAASYAPRSRATVQVQAGQPAAASVAVYRLDSLAAREPATDMAAYLLLAADLPGYVEDAGYYLHDSSATARQAADNLLLTQGWRRFRWDDVLAGPPPAPVFVPEQNGLLLQARVLRPGGAPAAGVPTYLSLPGSLFWFDNATSRVDGRVQFELPNFYGLRKLVLQTSSQQADSLDRVELLSPFTAGGGWAGGAAAGPGLPALPGLALPPPLPPRWAASLAERHQAVQAPGLFGGEAPPRYRAVPGDTAAFYGRPDERYFLDDFTRFPTMEEVMREYVPGVIVRKYRDGFHFIVVDRPRHINLRENPLTLIDGLPVFNVNQILAFDPLKIKRLDVMANRYFVGDQLHNGVVSYVTYKGDLAGFPLNPHALIEEYEALQVPREFYAPRYETAEQQHGRLPDLRNLLYWNADLRLLPGQPQTLDFYTADPAGRYLVVVQALGRNGQPGSSTLTFDVKPAL